MDASIICDRCGSAAHAEFIRVGQRLRGAIPAWIAKIACPRCGRYNRVKFHKSAIAVVVQATWSGTPPSFAQQ